VERVELTAVAGANVSAKRVWATINVGVEADMMTLDAAGGLRLHAYTSEGFFYTAASGSVSAVQPRVLCDGSTGLPTFGRDITALTATLGFSRTNAVPASFTRIESTYNAVYEVLPIGLQLDGPGEVGNGPQVTLYGWSGGEAAIAGGAISVAMTDIGGSHAATLSLWAAAGGALVAGATLTGAGVFTVTGGFVGPSIDQSAAAALAVGGTTATRVDLSKVGGGVRLLNLASAGIAHIAANGDLSSSAIVNADVDAAAAIAGTKISPDFGAQTITNAGRVETTRVVVAPSEPTSSGSAVTFNLSTSANIHHTTTENTTVTISGGSNGQHGIIVVSQGASGKTLTMPTNGSGVEYDNTIAALTTTGIIDTTALTRTLLAYYILPTGEPYIYARSVNTIP
jgi:hypothetical protein